MLLLLVELREGPLFPTLLLVGGWLPPPPLLPRKREEEVLLLVPLVLLLLEVEILASSCPPCGGETVKDVKSLYTYVNS